MASKPKCSVHVELDMIVEMRDRTKLAADVFRPGDPEIGEPVSDPMPVLLERTPYEKRENLQRPGNSTPLHPDRSRGEGIK